MLLSLLFCTTLSFLPDAVAPLPKTPPSDLTAPESAAKEEGSPHSLGRKAGQTVRKTGQAIGKAGKRVGESVKAGAQKVGQVAREGGEKIGQAASDLGKGIREGVKGD